MQTFRTENTKSFLLPLIMPWESHRCADVTANYFFDLMISCLNYCLIKKKKKKPEACAVKFIFFLIDYTKFILIKHRETGLKVLIYPRNKFFSKSFKVKVLSFSKIHTFSLNPFKMMDFCGYCGREGGGKPH